MLSGNATQLASRLESVADYISFGSYGVSGIPHPDCVHPWRMTAAVISLWLPIFVELGAADLLESIELNNLALPSGSIA